MYWQGMVPLPIVTALLPIGTALCPAGRPAKSALLFFSRLGPAAFVMCLETPPLRASWLLVELILAVTRCCLKSVLDAAVARALRGSAVDVQQTIHSGPIARHLGLRPAAEQG